MVYIQDSSIVMPNLASSAHCKKFPFLVDSLVDNRIAAPHWHDYMQIWYTVSGEYYHTINGERRKQSAGSVALVFPFTVHSIDSSKSDLEKTRVIAISVYDNELLESCATYSALSFSAASFERYLLSTFVNLTGRDKELCDELTAQISAEYSKKFDMNNGKILTRVLSILELCAKRLNTSIDSQKVTKMHDRFSIINEATTALHDCNLADTSLDSISKYVYMSKRQFTEKFKDTTGQTFGSYSKLLRLSRARQLVRYSQKSLTEIAEECGFTTRSYLINECRSAYGVAPLALKKRMLDDDRIWGEHLHKLNMDKFAWRLNLSESDQYEWHMYALGKA